MNGIVETSSEHRIHTTWWPSESTSNDQALLDNFYLYSILFSVNHAAGLACLALATANLGSDKGSTQTAILYAAYTTTAAFFATYVVSRLGSKNTTILGMGLFCFYVGSFYFAVAGTNTAARIMYLGAAIGGVGAGLAWTAQGTYFAETVEAWDRPNGSSRMAAIFACTVIVWETTLEALSTVLVRLLHVRWSFVFAVYAILSVLSTVAMCRIQSFQRDDAVTPRLANKGTSALRLFVEDSRMKYMIAFNAVYGFSGAFLNSFVSGEVVPIVSKDSSSSLVGVLAAFHGGAAAGASLFFGWLTSGRDQRWLKVSKTIVLAVGSVCFSIVVLPFFLISSPDAWNWPMLIMVYIVEGFGRASAEGTLKAIFADYFSYEKEGAFAAMILQYGSLSSTAYFTANSFLCSKSESSSSGCFKYRDGSLHDIRMFGTVVFLTGMLSVACLARAWCLDDPLPRNLARYDHVASTELSVRHDAG